MKTRYATTVVADNNRPSYKHVISDVIIHDVIIITIVCFAGEILAHSDTLEIHTVHLLHLSI